MTRDEARMAANAIMVSAAVVAVYVVATTPPLRRMATTAVRIWLGATVPAFLIGTAYRAWVESGRAA